MSDVTVNGRHYRAPACPTVVICFDGCDPAYVEQGLADGILPTIARFRKSGFYALADAVVPTFTNPNNASIVTGAPPAVHGISGNYYLDRATGRERMITDASLMRCGTILAALADAGVATAAVTAKDKLRLMLAHGLAGINFSSEHADRATEAQNGIGDVEAMVGRPRPDPYSGDLSLYVLDAGLRLIERGAARLLYLSLSDFIQHAHAPGAPEADSFNRAVDQRIGRLVAAGAVVGVVADHGMNDKSRPDGAPNVVYLEEELEARFGAGAARVICPITDPFVRHHGALGSFVRVYARTNADIPALMAASRELPGVEAVLDGAAAAARFELPPEIEGDFVVLGDAGTVIGSRRAEHDLAGLAGHRLRSHGGLGEQKVPFLLSHPLTAEWLAARAGRPLRNFDIFDATLNGVAGARP
jgi:phosphonoacetate hydrolase